MIFLLIVCLLASPGYSHASTPKGTVCFEDTLAGLWLLDFGSFLSGLNFDVHGFRANGNALCNDTFVEPVSGTATIDGDTIVFGAWSIANGPGANCESISWHIVLDRATFQTISGSFMTQSGVTDTFSLTEIDCSFVVTAAGKKSQNQRLPNH